jgi:steroid delta-isomerase-like uncharacterized protein
LPSLSEIENEKAIRKFIDAFNDRDMDSFLNVFADDAVLEFTSGRKGGKDFLKEWYNRIVERLPDSTYQIDRIATRNNSVWQELTFRATHTSEFLEVPATNKKIVFHGVAIADFVEGKVKLYKEYWNLELLKQFLRE